MYLLINKTKTGIIAKEAAVYRVPGKIGASKKVTRQSLVSELKRGTHV